MGNVPAKESRSRSSTFSSSSPRHADSTTFITRSSRRNTIGSSDNRKLARQQEKDKQREAHYTNLVVRYSENVDGGYLAPYGTYKSNLDYNSEIVRRLIINRQLAPFFTPLQDFDDDWSDEELLILLRQLPLHSIESAYSDEDEVDDADNHKISKSANYYKRQEQKAKLKSLIAQTKLLQKDEEQRFIDAKYSLKQSGDTVMNTSNPDIPNSTLLLKLYRNTSECPICFLYYPRYLNVSRCCLQPICTECFVQIKRLDPHPPHDDPGAQSNETPHTLISEEACCPYCASCDFGVTYDPPIDISCGINGACKPGVYVDPTGHESAIDDDAVSGSLLPKKSGKMRRRSSLAANAPGVITVDMIRPDWEAKLTTARNKLARKAATASAIHASNLLIESGSLNSRGRTQTYEDRMIEEALRLSIIDEEERKKKAAKEAKEAKKTAKH